MKLQKGNKWTQIVEVAKAVQPDIWKYMMLTLNCLIILLPSDSTILCHKGEWGTDWNLQQAFTTMSDTWHEFGHFLMYTFFFNVLYTLILKFLTTTIFRQIMFSIFALFHLMQARMWNACNIYSWLYVQYPTVVYAISLPRLCLHP